MVDEGATTHLIFSKVAFDRVDECVFQSYKILTENWRHVKVGSPIKRISVLVSIGYSRDNALCVIMIRYAQVICRWYSCSASGSIASQSGIDLHYLQRSRQLPAIAISC